jgi:NADH-quinone oxidoreductase subunit G
MRILPRLHEDVNEEWLADKSRFAYDGLKKRRLDVPMVRRGGRLEPVDWKTALAAVAERARGVPADRIAFLVGDQVDCETMVLVKELAARLGTPHLDCRQDGAPLETTPRAQYLFNTTIAGIEQADLCLLIGTNPRWEAPLLNARIRKRWRRGGFAVARIGAPFDLTYPVQDLGAGPATLEDLANGRHSFAERLASVERPMLILGTGAIARPDGAAVLALAHRLAENARLVREGWNGFNFLHTAAARVGGLELGLVPAAGGRDLAGILDGIERGAIELVFAVGVDEIDPKRLEKAFVVYLGTHGDRTAPIANVILPGAAYTEKNATWVNLEGRPQRGRLAVFPPGEAKEDWRILRALSEAMGALVPLDTLARVRERMAELAPQLAEPDRIRRAEWGSFGRPGPVDPAPFVSPVRDYWRTCPISRASAVMAECSALAAARNRAATGTHG